MYYDTNDDFFLHMLGGKDMFELVYKHLHQMLLRDVNREYHKYINLLPDDSLTFWISGSCGEAVVFLYNYRNHQQVYSRTSEIIHTLPQHY